MAAFQAPVDVLPVRATLTEAQKQMLKAAEIDLNSRIVPFAEKVSRAAKDLSRSLLEGKADPELRGRLADDLANRVSELASEAIRLRVSALSALIDRETSRVAFVVSTEGGMDIEQVAHDTPEKILTFSVDPATGIMPHHGRRVAQALKLSGDLAKQIEGLLPKLYKAFTEKDMSLLEINPLVVTKDAKLICLDAKVGFDDNALFRHPDVAALRDETEEDAKEIEASKYELNYIALDGEIGCMVNGAGLAMATMDIIKLYGMAPANFLDVGGSATKDKVAAAFKIITSDPNVKGILVTIFGGIMKCDIIAEGVVAAVKEVGLQVPLVVRLEGTNVEKGKEIIAKSNLNVTSANDLDDAAQKIVKAVKGA